MRCQLATLAHVAVAGRRNARAYRIGAQLIHQGKSEGL